VAGTDLHHPQLAVAHQEQPRLADDRGRRL
jgi:hypothetical protein